MPPKTKKLDPAQASRSVASIFELLNSGKISQAQGFLDEALKKFPENNSLRVAEAYTLLRSGDTTRALESALQLCDANFAEPESLEMLITVLKRCHAWQALAKCYERIQNGADKKVVAENLFQTYIFLGEYQKAASLSIQLFRNYGDPLYQVWTAQAYLAQVPRDSTDHIQLKLSGKLLDSFILTEKGLMNTSTVHMFLEVLLRQKQYDETITFLASERGSFIGLLETRLEHLAKVFLDKGEFSSASAVGRLLWKMEPDNWAPFQLYLSSIIAQVKAGQQNVSGSAQRIDNLLLEAKSEALKASIDFNTSDSTLEEALVLAKELQEKEEKERPQKPKRGPYMAELAILAEQITLEAPTSKGKHQTAMKSAILSYAKKFYRTPCCFMDISTFLSPEIASEIYEWSRESENVEGWTRSLNEHSKRILGLRCLVSCWGISVDTMPSPEEAEELIQICTKLYDSARPFSSNLVWSEEGLCDGYISVALNIYLRLFSASKETKYLLCGLQILERVDRKMNNPCWLIFSACFARYLGLADIAALGQLDFKSIQHDTMYHIGYLSLLPGVPIACLDSWNEEAMKFYSGLESECSLLRANVLKHATWQAFQDIQQYEYKQHHSMIRWVTIASSSVLMLKKCQTQREILEFFERRGSNIVEARNALQEPNRKELLYNLDWTVVKAQILGNIHSNDVESLAHLLAPTLTIDEMATKALGILNSILMLRDVAVLSHQKSPQSLKKNHSQQATNVNSENACFEALSLSKEASSQFSPILDAIAEPLLSWIDKQGAVEVAHTPNLKEKLEQLINSPRSSLQVENFFCEEAFILSSLLTIGDNKRLPIRAWAKEYLEFLSSVGHSYALPENVCPLVDTDKAGVFVGDLIKHKISSIRIVVHDLTPGLTACTRLK